MATGAFKDHRAARVPVGVDIGLGALVMVATTLVAAAVTPDRPVRLVLVAAAAGGFAAFTADIRAAVVTAGLGYLLFRGFLVSRYGELAWDGAASLGHLLVFAVALALGLVYRGLRGVSRRRWSGQGRGGRTGR